MTRQISITVSGELGGIAPDPNTVREHMLNALDETNSTIINSNVSITTNDQPTKVLPPEPMGDCKLVGCYEPMPHTHGTDGPVSDSDR